MKKVVIVAALVIIAIFTYLFYFSAPEITNPVPSGGNVICFGDSLTSGYGASEGMDYPSQLSLMLGEPVINAGVPGDTTATALKRLEEDVLSRSPRVVLVILGGNDLKNGVPREEAFANLRAIIMAIQKEGALVIVGGIQVPFWGRGFGKEYKRLCNKLGAVLVPNVLEDIFGNPALMSDRIHPNDAGYKRMAQRFYKALKPYL